MDMRKKAKDWLEQARYDLDSAEVMFQAGKYLYVCFMCQQAIEKLLKGLYLAKTSQLAPFTHNLIRLAQLVELETDDDRDRLFGELQRYYIESRYPDEIEGLNASLDRGKADALLKGTKEYFNCLEQQIEI